MSAYGTRSLEWVIVPLRECKQPDVFGPLLFPHSHLLWQKLSIPIIGSFKRNCFELLCFYHMGKSLQSYSLKRNLNCVRMSVSVMKDSVWLVHKSGLRSEYWVWQLLGSYVICDWDLLSHQSFCPLDTKIWTHTYALRSSKPTRRNTNWN